MNEKDSKKFVPFSFIYNPPQLFASSDAFQSCSLRSRTLPLAQSAPSRGKRGHGLERLQVKM